MEHLIKATLVWYNFSNMDILWKIFGIRIFCQNTIRIVQYLCCSQITFISMSSHCFMEGHLNVDVIIIDRKHGQIKGEIHSVSPLNTILYNEICSPEMLVLWR